MIYLFLLFLFLLVNLLELLLKINEINLGGRGRGGCGGGGAEMVTVVCVCVYLLHLQTECVPLLHQLVLIGQQLTHLLGAALTELVQLLQPGGTGVTSTLFKNTKLHLKTSSCQSCLSEWGHQRSPVQWKGGGGCSQSLNRSRGGDSNEGE